MKRIRLVKLELSSDLSNTQVTFEIGNKEYGMEEMLEVTPGEVGEPLTVVSESSPIELLMAAMGCDEDEGVLYRHEKTHPHDPVQFVTLESLDVIE
jgi:hypothetical protein